MALQLAKPELIPTAELYLDPENPRLAGLDIEFGDQVEIARILWEERAVNELASSIGSSGYWSHEVLFAAREHDVLVVIEGNRRLAAVKILLDPELRVAVGASGVPEISDELKENLSSLPVIVCTRQEIWEYIGFKHVNGPQDWDSIAKAQYIARVHNDYGVPLDDIARTIGDEHNTVRRLYRGLMVLDQAEATGRFSREDRFNTRFAYSHLWTGLGYSGIQEFLGLGPDQGFSKNPVPEENVENLIQLCRWLYGSKADRMPPVIRSQNPDLRQLDEVLRSKDGEIALRSGLALDTALNISRGDKRLLREALVLGEQKLREARGLVDTGYEGEEDLLKKARDIEKLARGIAGSMNELYSVAQIVATPRAGGV
jgi:hypothetical protein